MFRDQKQKKESISSLEKENYGQADTRGIKKWENGSLSLIDSQGEEK